MDDTADDRPTLIDGPTLRALRMQRQVPLRKVATMAKMSHGHLSKLERDEPGRQVTPAVLAAYGKALGVNLTDVEPSDTRGGWRPGQLDQSARRHFTGKVAAVAWGTPVDYRLDRFADLRNIRLPTDLDEAQLSQLAHVADLLASLPGSVPGLVAHSALQWVASLLDHQEGEAPNNPGLYLVIAQLAKRAALAGVEIGAHEVARQLHLAALHATVRADDADLRAQVLVDIAEHLHLLQHHADCREVARLGEVDERVTDVTRQALRAVKTRAHDAEQRLLAELRQVQADEPADGEKGGVAGARAGRGRQP